MYVQVLRGALIATLLLGTVGLRVGKTRSSLSNDLEKPKPPQLEKCEVPADFVRTVNPHAVRKPTEEEKSQPGFYDEPHLEKIYYINLDTSPDRRTYIEREISTNFPGVAFQRLRATTRHESQHFNKNIKEFSLYGLGSKVTSASQATWYSHFFALKNISMEKDPNAVYLIIEDDVKLGRKGHNTTLMEHLMCQIKMLPPEWDRFEFGYKGFQEVNLLPEEQRKHTVPYPTCPGAEINKYTCHQRKWSWNYLGTQGYAVRPRGAATLIEHLRKSPLMDIDGALQPGITWSRKLGKPAWPNTYVSKHNLIGHGGFKSDRNEPFWATQEPKKPVTELKETQNLADESNDYDDSKERMQSILSTGESFFQG